MNELPDHLAARRAGAAGQRFAILARQKAFFEPDVEVVPGQPRRDDNRAEKLGRVDPKMLQRFLPQRKLHVLFPRVHARTLVVGPLDDVAEPAIAARQNAFEYAGLAVVRLQFQAAHLAHGVPQHLLLALRLRQRVLRTPLKWRVRLGHVRRHTDRYLRASAHALADLQRVRPDRGDAQHVFVLLRGQADHEVQLHAIEAARKRALCGFEQLLFGHVFVDHVAHALRAGFGRKRQARCAHLPHVVE